MLTSAPSSESNLNVNEDQPSKWNYAVPAIATLAWIGCWCALGIYVKNEVHNYQYPKNPINENIIAISRNAMISLGSIGLATIPTAVCVTAAKAVYSGTRVVGSGLNAAGSAIQEAIKKSISLEELGSPEGIMINTLVAPIIIPACVVGVILDRANRERN